LRVLEVQSAQLGVNCPAHVQVEVESIKNAISVIEQKLGSDSLSVVPIRTTRLPLLFRSVFSIICISLLIGLIWVFSSYFHPVLAAAHTPNLPGHDSPAIPVSETALGNDTSAVQALAISCGNDIVVLSNRSGLIVWKNAELDKVSLTHIPPGSRLELRCIVYGIGEAEIVLVRKVLIEENDVRVAWVIKEYRCWSHEDTVPPSKTRDR